MILSRITEGSGSWDSHLLFEADCTDISFLKGNLESMFLKL